MAVVGTRRPSLEGGRYARALAAALVEAGHVVWSGGALGVDLAAHEGSLSAGGRTVLVAGGGLNARYPCSEVRLFERVLAQRGALLAIVPDEAPPQRWSFLARNAVLAAMTAVTVVVEAPLRSGARSTASAARKLGRPVWIASQPPWSPFAATVQDELQRGARLLLDTSRLLAELASLATNDGSVVAQVQRDPSAALAAHTTHSATMAVPEGLGGQLVEALRGGPLALGDLCERLGTSVPQVLAQVSLLALAGVVQYGPGGLVELVSI